jgi:GDPmannose 4,6-dehydratase
MYAMLQGDRPEDFVIATGKSRSLEDFIAVAFEHVGLNWKEYLMIDRSLFRPTEITVGRGDASKAAQMLGWLPRYQMEDVVRMMVDACRVAQGEK